MLKEIDCHISFQRTSFASLFFLLFFLLCNFSVFFASVPNTFAGEDKTEEEALQEILKKREEKLWKAANEAFLTGEDKEAADLYRQYYRKYPDSPNAEEALWSTANLHMNLALADPEADWGKVKDLFRTFTLDFPQSPHLGDAYFFVGRSFYHMRYYREALTYWGLFLKRFPDSEKVNEARYMKARALLDIGRTSEAKAAFRELSQSPDPIYSLRGQSGEAHIHFANNEYHDALAIYLKILRKNPSFYINDPDMLRNKGIANLRVGNREEGRQDLFKYLNLTGLTASRPEILFELAESYVDEGKNDTARRLFEQIIDEGADEDRVVVLSRFRIAHMEETQDNPEEEEKILSPEGDEPFHDVLDRHYTDPLSQDARFDLVKRFWERQEYDNAYDMGKAYLRYETVEKEKKEILDIMGKVLYVRMEKLFQEKKYEQIYSLYQDEYTYLKEYTGGELLYLVGRALEEMALYRQAGVVYYRALGLTLSDARKLDLYIHRAQSYLADNDIKSAQRLLKYLRKIYADNPAMGEICSLSGRLREIQKRNSDALKFYRIAVENPTFAEKKKQYAGDYLRLLLDQDELLENAAILETFHGEKWLDPGQLQYWYGKLGQEYEAQNNFDKAIEAYRSALADDMPQGDETAQLMHIHLGDALLLQGVTKEGIDNYQKALDGKSELVKKMAQQRLDQEDIKKAMSETEAVLKN